MSQHAYMWNRNNAFAFEDPSGYFAIGGYWSADLSPPPNESEAPPPGTSTIDNDEETDANKQLQGERYLQNEQNDIDSRVGVPANAPQFGKNALSKIFTGAAGHFSPEENTAENRALIRKAAALGTRATRGTRGGSQGTVMRSRYRVNSGHYIWVDVYTHPGAQPIIINAGIDLVPMVRP